MQGHQRLVALAKSFLIISAFIAFVLLVSYPVIDFNMMYPEQPIIYLANQRINSLSDLLNVYLHPQMFAFTIPFFRPSGHFLIYQLLYLFIDPLNFKAFTIVNLIFLALSGVLVTRIYPLVFPGFRMGGYIAFAIYLMHPALILSRMISLHFEFAYIFFMLLSLYSFIKFFQSNDFHNKNQFEDIKSVSLFFLAIISYVIATTFKEPAVLLGPSLGLYFLIFTYHGQGVLAFTRYLILQRQPRNVLMLLGVVSVTMLIYITLAWPTMANPLKDNTTHQDVFFSIGQLFYYVLNLDITYSPPVDAGEFFRVIVFTLGATIVIWLSVVSTASMYLLLKKDKPFSVGIYKKSLAFFILSALFYLSLPILWGKAYAWHFSMTILMMSFVVGFSIDYLASLFLQSERIKNICCAAFAIVFAAQAYWTNAAAVNFFSDSKVFSLEFNLLSNAILAPPNIKSKLTSDSVIVIQDNILKDNYITSGGQLYPFLAFDSVRYDVSASYDIAQRIFGDIFFKLNHDYSGTLFRSAYLMPDMREMSYPFDVNEMDAVDSAMIYFWLLEYNNIFCLGYDLNGQWHDLTEKFKQNLLAEKFKRGIEISSYKNTAFVSLKGTITKSMSLPYPDEKLCQYTCDQQPLCEGFTYKNYIVYNKRVTMCEYYQHVKTDTASCVACTSYVKTKKLQIY